MVMYQGDCVSLNIGYCISIVRAVIITMAHVLTVRLNGHSVDIF